MTKQSNNDELQKAAMGLFTKRAEEPSRQSATRPVESSVPAMGKKGRRAVKDTVWAGKTQIHRTMAFDEVHLRKLGKIAQQEEMPLKDLVFEFLDYAIRAYEDVHGEVVVTTRETARRALFGDR